MSLLKDALKLYLVFGLVWLCLPTAHADEIRPAYLHLKQLTDEQFDVAWKVPARGDNQRLSLYVQFEPEVETVREPQAHMADQALHEWWQIRAESGLAGRAIEIQGLPRSNSEVIVHIDYLDGSSFVHRLTPSSSRVVIEARPGIMQVVATYFVLGIEHILIGIDHLLFVLVLLWLVDGLRKLIITITAFTLAHSITLSMASLGMVHIPIAPVEATIALSIVFVACEIVRHKQGAFSLTRERPWIVAFSFGLLHGLGFAAALGEIGLPQHAIPAALLFFNLGVEAGQIAFVFVILGLTALWQRLPLTLPRAAELLPVYVVGSVAAYWTIERTVGFWS